MSETPLSDLLAAVRRNDEAAAEALVRRYEPMLLGEFRLTLRAPVLKDDMETRDLIQSVFLRVFEKIREGDEFPNEAAFAGFLRKIGLNRLRDHIDRVKTAKRDHGRTARGEAHLAEVADKATTPERLAEVREEADRVAKEMSPSELHLLEERAAGVEWNELAAQFDTTPEALRKRIERVRERVRKALDNGR